MGPVVEIVSKSMLEPLLNCSLKFHACEKLIALFSLLSSKVFNIVYLKLLI